MPVFAAKKPFADRGMRSGGFGFAEPALRSRGMNPVSSMAAFSAAVSPPSISGNRTGAGVATSTLATIMALEPADSRNSYFWRQISGDVMTIASPNAASTTFSRTLSDGGSAAAVFGCTVCNDYGQVTEATPVSVSLDSTPSYTPMSISADPSSLTIIYTDGAGNASAGFSVSVSGGLAPYTYSWGGGPGDGTPSNFVDVHIDTPGGSADFAPGCAVTDATAASVGAAPGPFTFVRPL